MSTIYRACLLAALLAPAACGGDDNGFSPTRETVAGGYTASVFTLTTPTGPADSTTADLLALGASVDVFLDPAGTTSGRLFVPGTVVGGADIDEDLAGTWTLSGNIVTFNQTGGSLISGARFAAGPQTLTGEQEFQTSVVKLVLFAAQ